MILFLWPPKRLTRIGFFLKLSGRFRLLSVDVNSLALPLTDKRKIGAAQVDFAAQRIDGPTGGHTMEPKVMAVLDRLLRQAPEVVTRQALIDDVWAGESGGDESLSRAISLLRKALGDLRGSHTYIETIPRRGYRLVAEVDPLKDEPKPPARVSRKAPLARMALLMFLLAAGVAIWLFGSGLDLVRRDEPVTHSIAVLPFTDMTPEQDRRYFADGLSEEILNALMRIPDLRVTGRTSAFVFRDRAVELREIGAALDVSHVLEGSVRRQGNDVRIAAQLIQTRDGIHLWSKTFEGDVTGLFDMQEKIARAIARELELVLDLPLASRLAPPLTSDRAAYDSYLQGRELSLRFGAEAKSNAIMLLQEAVALDPDFAQAWAVLGRAHLLAAADNPDDDPKPYVESATRAVERSLDLDPNLAYAHLVQASIFDYELDVAAAVDAAARAHELDPHQPFLTMSYGYYLVLIGQVERGAALMRQALRQDPTDAVGLSNLAGASMALGDFAEAERLYRRSYELGFKPAAIWLAIVVAHQEWIDEALAIWNDQRDELASRYPPGFEHADLWHTAGRAFLTNDEPARLEVADRMRRYFASSDSRTNAYRVGLLGSIGEYEAFMQLFTQRPFPINATLLYNMWDDRPASQGVRRHQNFSRFADTVGLVKAWQRHGWPAQCRPFPGTDGAAAQFSCR